MRSTEAMLNSIWSVYLWIVFSLALSFDCRLRPNWARSRRCHLHRRRHMSSRSCATDGISTLNSHHQSDCCPSDRFAVVDAAAFSFWPVRFGTRLVRRVRWVRSRRPVVRALCDTASDSPRTHRETYDAVMMWVWCVDVLLRACDWHWCCCQNNRLRRDCRLHRLQNGYVRESRTMFTRDTYMQSSCDFINCCQLASKILICWSGPYLDWNWNLNLNCLQIDTFGLCVIFLRWAFCYWLEINQAIRNWEFTVLVQIKMIWQNKFTNWQLVCIELFVVKSA